MTRPAGALQWAGAMRNSWLARRASAPWRLRTSRRWCLWRSMVAGVTAVVWTRASAAGANSLQRPGAATPHACGLGWLSGTRKPAIRRLPGAPAIVPEPQCLAKLAQPPVVVSRIGGRIHGNPRGGNEIRSCVFSYCRRGLEADVLQCGKWDRELIGSDKLELPD